MSDSPHLSLASLKNLIDAGEIDTVLTVFPDHYGRLMGKRICAQFFLETIQAHGIHACDYLLTTDIDMNPVPGFSFANWERGYGDFHGVPDYRTLRRAAWLPKSALVICDLENEADHKAIAVSPRAILKNQVAAASELGFSAKAASELEYFLFKNSFEEARDKNYHNLKTFSAYIEDYHMLQGTREEVINAPARRLLNQSGVPVEFSKGEWGPGQHELNIRYCEVLEMADRHTLFKQCLKEIADQHGHSVSFMAKFAEELAGSSCHMHVSLWNRAGTEARFPGDRSGLGPFSCSDTFRWFLAGWMKYAPDFMPFFAPTVNSYKRYQAGSWAPTGLAWSYDNRTAGFRVVGNGPSLRIESRICGADVNPYLGYAAVLAAGLAGIRQKLEPPAMFQGDVYAAADLPQVPTTLADALERLRKSTVARQAFGDTVIDHYLHFYQTEWDAYQRSVSDWERRRYFEQI
ncbi:glutamine synthetase family protein [Acanthopleuribacter pedis]|uniref:Glutamine synthetase n=1 Tax=Acanthopleuribacter pedis TaxID=442870 RepID=A0A8J7QH43_9BACT|nr:glutamine synthetase family protein [Acanthopleuribacter pedis]MBO1320060.1 glutamine synthetase [Acanthopleuribacter pedis]